ncbi:hypothetical protein [Streptomyces sp. NBC_00503]|uniref:hypothetical protein n=1 Tax=Streptomyces sp. NBC_00503 TaxID=2903659 RepID=UPI002E8222B2|nr:hypothetical protein [Streptomyces sp. NBC_00503]WUD86417.1 hypothetical protein OG490_38040 [Streptomyces sp. NBC_00503]
MGSGNMWNAGPRGRAEGRESLVRLTSRAARVGPYEQAAAVLIVCSMCGSDEFEVVAAECFCFGCCLPLGVPDGSELLPGSYPWKLEPSEVPLPTHTPGPFRPEEVCWCPARHGVFEVAIAFGLDADGRVAGLSVGLRCPEDGGLLLHIDNARVVATGS